MTNKYVKPFLTIYKRLEIWRPKSKARGWLALSAIYLALTLVFGYLLFPYDYLKEYVLQELRFPKTPDGTRTESAYDISIRELSPSWFTGVELEGLRVTQRSVASSEEPLEIYLTSLTLRPSVWALLKGDSAFSFVAEVGDGDIDGGYAASEEEVSFAAEFSDVDLHELKVLKSLVGLPAKGVINGKIDLQVAATPDETEGIIDLSIGKLTIGDSKAKFKTALMPSGMTIEQIDAGDLALKITVIKGVGQVETLNAKGKDLELSGFGEIRPRNPLGQSGIDVLVRFKFSEEYRNRSDVNIGLFMLLDNEPTMRKALSKDGWLQYRLRGTLNRIQPRPDGHARARRS
ncbi:MAG: type II secretion system protein GspN [Myxococcales bacterium]|nr:type II secretion system protein GspN [Myxococcales bacterium]MCB9709263.1 type II secretion system protein GspN [Myxococcales bacterium]